MIVLDTSALVCWFMEPDRLTAAARRVIDGPGRRAISSISVWEIALKVNRGRLELPGTIEEFAARLERVGDLEVVPVDTRAWLDSVALQWSHADPADRVIVALANRFDCPLVSSDKTIARFYSKTIW